jgi:hypothetical protein
MRASIKQNERHLRRREEGRFDTGTWFEFGRNQNIDLMLVPKILVPDIADRAAFALDEAGEFAFTSGYGITLRAGVSESLKFVLGLANSRVLDFFWRKVSTPLRGGFYRYFTQYIEQLPIPAATPAQQAGIERVVDYLLWLHRQPEVTAGREPRDPVMLAFWEQVVNALVYELFFPAELAAARLPFFRLVDEAGLRPLAELPTADGRKTCINDAERLTSLRTTFERLNATSHPLRAALFTLAGLDFVRLIEGRTPPGEAIPEPATPASP